MRLELSPAELAEKLGISVGTFRNRYAGNLQLINEKLKELGEKLRVVEKKKVGKNTVFILESIAYPSSLSPISKEAGSPPPASSFSPVITEKDTEELNQLSSDKRQEALEKLKVVKYAMSFGIRPAAKAFGKTPSSVHRWCRTYTTQGVKALVGITEKEYSEALRHVLSLAEAKFCLPKKLTIKSIYDEVKKLANELGINLTYEQLRQHLNDFYARKKYYVERLRSGESKAIRYRPRAGHVQKVAPNHRWEWDHTRMDNVVIHDGKEIRPWLSIIRDTYSNYIVSYLLLPYNPHAGTVAQLILQAIKQFGIPKIIRTDWGKDFKAERILAGLKELGIHVSNAKPYSGWDKGNVESGFKIIKMQFCKTLPGYTQEDPKERKDVERIWGKEELLSFEEYEKLFAQYVENYNLDKAEVYKPHERKGVDGDWLYWAFAERKVRTVTNATVRIDHEYYYAEALEEYEGQKVEVRLDDSNDTYVKVFTLDGKFICDAVSEKENPESWRDRVKRRERKKKAIEKTVKARLELHELEQERKKEAETKLHYSEMEALLKEESEETIPEADITIPEDSEEPDPFIPTDDYELLTYIIDRKGQVPEEIWKAYEKFKTENPMAFSLYASEIEEIEELKKEVKR